MNKMHIDLLSIFPEIFQSPLEYSIIARAREKGLLTIDNHDIRDYALDKHKMVDDRPYGGGPGMVMKVEPLWRALTSLTKKSTVKKPRVILLTPKGEKYSQQKALELSQEEWLILVCGRYKGVDERIRNSLITDELSIGDYVLTGGEIPALVIVDTIIRLIPGVLGDEDSATTDSFYQDFLEHPHYTRPPVFKDMAVPEVLLGGDHQKIALWRRKESLRQTLRSRPDLFIGKELNKEDLKLLKEIELEENNLENGPAERRIPCEDN